ncbi:hypothetical protein KOW79_004495 [Hemibagrus wyckioides]|uniref:Uncharacterized protein n=1 Tax=Hemibagrus wyckioides TaxID=337641 RepID=A0A9D3SPQ9_9TELE|nr:hypothetical protein KOW79_004495 [Hemibagrus wyckioides]
MNSSLLSTGLSYVTNLKSAGNALRHRCYFPGRSEATLMRADYFETDSTALRSPRDTRYPRHSCIVPGLSGICETFQSCPPPHRMSA